MIVIACVDDRMGMLFNRRRQSQDAALRQRLLQRAARRTIWMSEYSARQFADCQADNIRVSDHCADQAEGPGGAEQPCVQSRASASR